MRMRARQWLPLACALGCALSACSGGGVVFDASTDITTQPETAPGTDARPDTTTGMDVQGTDARADAQGSDVQRADVVGTDVVGTDVVGTDVVGTDVIPGGACMTPIRALTLPMDSAMGTLAAAPDTIPSAGCQSSTPGAEHVYTLHVATRTGVQLATTTSIDTVLSIRSMCASAASEVACDDDNGTGNASLLRTTLDPGDYAVIVDQYASSPPASGGAYTLSLSTFTVAPNATCAGAAALGTTAAMGNSNDSTTVTDPCDVTTDATLLYYTLSIPAGQRAVVTAMPTGTPAWSPVVRVLDGCAATTCSTGAIAPADGMPATVTVDNRGSATRDVVLAISGQDAASGGAFTLSAALSMLTVAANAQCAMATMVSGGAMLMTQDLNAGGPSLASVCYDVSAGPVLYYRATIPAGNTMTFTATPPTTSDLDPAIRVLDTCAATTCAQYVDNGFSGDPESITVGNPGATARDVIFAVSADDPAALGAVDIGVTTAVIPYAETSLAAACDDMTTGTVLTAINDDDTTSALLALPFAFDLMGSAITQYSVSSNGFAQLYTAAGGTAETASGNDPIPTDAAPNGVVAPFWDDLLPRATSDVRTLVTGTAPNRHLTIQWTDTSFYDNDTDAHLTFQAKLFEGSNVVEFHYCALTTPSTTLQFHTGESATIGIENLAGTRGVQHSFDTPMAVAPARALRYTPVP